MGVWQVAVKAESDSDEGFMLTVRTPVAKTVGGAQDPATVLPPGGTLRLKLSSVEQRSTWARQLRQRRAAALRQLFGRLSAFARGADCSAGGHLTRVHISVTPASARRGFFCC